MTNVVFVAPYALEATSRFVDAVARVEGARVGLISSDPLESFAASTRLAIAGHWRIADCLDVDQLTAAVTTMSGHLGSVDRLVSILENLQVPVAMVRERLGIHGLGVDVATRFRDKSTMKAAFEAAGVACARGGRVDDGEAARRFAATVGYPLVVKPLAGAGARNTVRVESAEHLERWLATAAPTPADPALLEEFVRGDEHSFDSVLLDGSLVWYSISRYLPSPLEVVTNPWIQWCVLLPRVLDDPAFRGVAPLAHQALTALGLRTGLSHMEWFRRGDGTLAVSEVGARPPGAQFMTLLSYAHDVDMYSAWARFVVEERFEPPSRAWAVGAAYVRAQGAGRAIVAAEGLDRISDATRSRVVEVRLPSRGDRPRGTYEGDGWVIVRDRDTRAVEDALGELVSTIRLECG